MRQYLHEHQTRRSWSFSRKGSTIDCQSSHISGTTPWPRPPARAQFVDEHIQQSHQLLLQHPLGELRVSAERVVADVAVVVRRATPHHECRVLNHVPIALHAQQDLPHAATQETACAVGRQPALVTRQAVHHHQPLELPPALVVGRQGDTGQQRLVQAAQLDVRVLYRRYERVLGKIAWNSTVYVVIICCCKFL
jgi:hypothetical protein